jgi:hypothetical protein
MLESNQGLSLSEKSGVPKSMMEIPMDFLNKHGLNDGLKDIQNATNTL